jgi:hypothetical protein
MERGYVSMTPLSLDLTDQPGLDRLVAVQPLDGPPAEAPSESVEEDESR